MHTLNLSSLKNNSMYTLNSQNANSIEIFKDADIKNFSTSILNFQYLEISNFVKDDVIIFSREWKFLNLNFFKFFARISLTFSI